MAGMGVGGRVGVPAILAWTMFVGFGAPGWASGAEARPNILLIMTDDQGYGDLGFHGNPKIRTPNLDRFARESVRLKSFYVSPVCSPTRSSLMTGRYNYRTGVVDTYAGRSLMHPDETTIAEVLAASGYRTGIFGKWHLGDNAPMRPIDQGFQEALVIKGGGIGQASDPPGGSSYFDPILQHNGRPQKYQGYCSDIYTTAAIDFLGAGGDRPFFAYLAFNCPHDPLEAPEAELATYKSMNLAPDEFPKLGQPIPPAFMSPADDDRQGLRDGHEHRHQRGPDPLGPRGARSGPRYDRHFPHRQWPGPGPFQRGPARLERDRLRRGHPRPLLHPLAGSISRRVVWSIGSPPISTSFRPCSRHAESPGPMACDSMAGA